MLACKMECEYIVLPIINYQLSIINYQLSIINYQLPIINYQLSIINYQLSICKTIPFYHKANKKP